MTFFLGPSRIKFAFVCAVSLNAACHAPTALADDAFNLGQQEAVINETADLVHEYYVLEEKGKELAQKLRAEQSLRAGFASKDAFMEGVNAYLLREGNDRHLKMSRVMSARSAQSPKQAKPRDELEEIARMRARFFREAVSMNYGVQSASVLDGNIGYLRIDHFFEPVFARPQIDAAFSLLANTDALIVDLCRNNGGHEDGLQSFISHFFETPRHYAVSIDRSENDTSRKWSLPFYAVYDEQKPLFIVTCARTFSAGEAFTFFMKKQGRGIIVGEKTRGGGYAGNFYPLKSDSELQLFVSTARTFDPESGEDWEARGIIPDIAATADDAVPRAHVEALKITIADEDFDDLRAELSEIISDLEQAD